MGERDDCRRGRRGTDRFLSRRRRLRIESSDADGAGLMDTPNETDSGGAGQADATAAAASSGGPPKRWYIVHTYSGQETRAKKALLERAKSLGFEDAFEEILVPEESVVEMVGGQKRTSNVRLPTVTLSP